jgi:hypothetical protein
LFIRSKECDRIPCEADILLQMQTQCQRASDHGVRTSWTAHSATVHASCMRVLCAVCMCVLCSLYVPLLFYVGSGQDLVFYGGGALPQPLPGVHQAAKLALATSHELPGPAPSLCAAHQAQAPPPPGGGLQEGLPMEAASKIYMADSGWRGPRPPARPLAGHVPCAHANGLWPFLFFCFLLLVRVGLVLAAARGGLVVAAA